MSTVVTLGVSLEVGCNYDHMCGRFASGLFDQLDSGRYGECSVLRLPATLGEWRDEHRTARKRADRAERRGYTVANLVREAWADDINEINMSAPERQGRPMSEGYREPQTFSPLPRYPCDRHAIRVSGVWSREGALVAYLAMHRAGDLALVSQILGHAQHLENEVMYLLFQFGLCRELGRGDGVCVYNRHDSGTDGLRFFKERLGFSEQRVEWLP